MSRMKTITIAFIGLLPASPAKNLLMNVFGHRVGKGCRIGICLLWDVRSIELHDGASIGNFNVLRNLKMLKLGLRTSIGAWNWISAAPLFAESAPEAGSLYVDRESAITSRHYVDCSGGVRIGMFATVGGHRTTILTHGIDFSSNRQTAGPVLVGDYTFVSTGCTLLKGSMLPDQSLLAAGAVLTERRSESAPGGMWGGVPAKRISDISGDYFSRNTGYVR